MATKHNLSHRSLWIGGGALLIFFLTSRLVNLTALPIFVDEGLHIHRAQRMLAGGDFIHGTAAGKFLHIWGLASVINLTDFSLIAARLLSVGAGAMAGLTTFYLARLLWPGRNSGWAAAFIYVALPLPLMNDRLALADSLFTTLTTLTLIFSLKQSQQPRKSTGYALGLCLGLTYLTKINSLIYLVIPIFSVILLRSDWRQSLKILIRPYFVAFVIALPTATEFINQFLSVAVRGLPDPTQANLPPTRWMLYGLGETWLDLTAYVTRPVLILAGMGLVYGIKSGDRRASLLAALLLLTPLPYILLGKDVWYSRYLLPMVPLFAVLAARTLADLAHLLARKTRLKPENLWLGALCVLTLIPSFNFAYQFITAPSQAPLTPVDRWQYIVGWPAGYGLAEAAVWLAQEAEKEGPLTVITTQYPGPTQEGLRIYLGRRHPDLHLLAADLRPEASETLSSLIQNQAGPTLLLLNEPADPNGDPLTSLCPRVLAVFPKPENQSRLVVKECTVSSENTTADRRPMFSLSLSSPAGLPDSLENRPETGDA